MSFGFGHHKNVFVYMSSIPQKDEVYIFPCSHKVHDILNYLDM